MKDNAVYTLTVIPMELFLMEVWKCFSLFIYSVPPFQFVVINHEATQQKIGHEIKQIAVDRRSSAACLLIHFVSSLVLWLDPRSLMYEMCRPASKL
jgi:hypothetical protein